MESRSAELQKIAGICFVPTPVTFRPTTYGLDARGVQDEIQMMLHPIWLKTYLRTNPYPMGRDGYPIRCLKAGRGVGSFALRKLGDAGQIHRLLPALLDTCGFLCSAAFLFHSSSPCLLQNNSARRPYGISPKWQATAHRVSLSQDTISQRAS